MLFLFTGCNASKATCESVFILNGQYNIYAFIIIFETLIRTFNLNNLLGRVNV